MSGIIPGDWFAIGQTFANPPYYFENPKGNDECAKNFGVSIGIQCLTAMDVESEYIFCSEPLERIPGTLTSIEVLRILLQVMQKNGKPRVGWVISESVWQSSLEMVGGDQTEGRGKYLFDLDISFGAMKENEKDKIRSKITAIGLKCAFGQEEFEKLN